MPILSMLVIANFIKKNLKKKYYIFINAEFFWKVFLHEQMKLLILITNNKFEFEKNFDSDKFEISCTSNVLP